MAISESMGAEKSEKKKKAASKAKKPAAKKGGKKPAAKKKAEPKKAAAEKPAAKEAEIVPKAEEPKENEGAAPTLTDFKDFEPPVLVINGEKGLRWSMAQLNEALEESTKELAKSDYRQALIITHQLKNGKFNELGYKNAREYYEAKFGLAPTTADRYLRVLWFLRDRLNIKKDEKLQEVYENCIVRRVHSIAGFVASGAMTIEQAKEEMTYCTRDSDKTQAEWELRIKEHYGKQIKATNAEAANEHGMVKVGGFKLEEADFDTLQQAHKIAQKIEEDPTLSLGSAVARMAAHFASHYGEGIIDLAQSIQNLERAHGMLLLPIGIPGHPNAPKVSAIKVYEDPESGTRIFHDSKRNAAKALGIATSDVKEVLIDPRHYLSHLGYSEKPKNTHKAPKALEELTDEEVLEKLNELREELGFTRDEWTDRAVGKSSRQQVVELLGLKEKKDAGEPVKIRGKDKDDGFEEPKKEKKKTESKKKKEPAPKPVEEEEEEEEDGGIFEDEETGMFFLDEAMTIPCNEYGEPIDDDGNVVEAE